MNLNGVSYSILVSDKDFKKDLRLIFKMISGFSILVLLQCLIGQGYMYFLKNIFGLLKNLYLGTCLKISIFGEKTESKTNQSDSCLI